MTTEIPLRQRRNIVIAHFPNTSPDSFAKILIGKLEERHRDTMNTPAPPFRIHSLAEHRLYAEALEIALSELAPDCEACWIIDQRKAVLGIRIAGVEQQIAVRVIEALLN